MITITPTGFSNKQFKIATGDSERSHRPLSYYSKPLYLTARLTMQRNLRPNGRALFDIYNRDHMRTLPAKETSERSGMNIHTFRSWDGDRMRCELEYEDAPADVFEWQLYTPDEFGTLAERSGFNEIARCAWFNETMAPSARHARMQFILERS